MILIDEPRDVTFRRFKRTAHCMSTLLGAAGTAELVAFCRRLGMKPQWLQKPGDPTEHFDLFDGRLDAAIKAGAEVVSGRELVARCVTPKRRAAGRAIATADLYDALQGDGRFDGRETER